jgi:hypothetical protein
VLVRLNDPNGLAMAAGAAEHQQGPEDWSMKRLPKWQRRIPRRHMSNRSAIWCKHTGMFRARAADIALDREDTLLFGAIAELDVEDGTAEQ